MKDMQQTFHKYVSVNDHDLLLAIREGLRPMQSIADEAHDGLPYFGNDMAGFEPIGNTHDGFLSLSHVPGRWLDALLNAESLPGMSIDEAVIQRLTRWAHASVEDAGMGLPAQIDLETFQIKKVSQLHNLREVMHAFTALYQYRSDRRACDLAKSVIGSVDRYYVSSGFVFDRDRLLAETGGSVTVTDPFPLTFGRYIGTLVKFYRVSQYEPALQQAIRLKDYCLQAVMLDDDTYDVEKLGKHTHSVTSMMSSLALLGEELNDRALLDRVSRFLDHGLRQCTLDFGWCLVGFLRDDLMGEINNTADIMETCLILAKAGYPGYYARAEKILRAHLLPSQLLDTHFVPVFTDQTDTNRYNLHERARGAFGFPCPFGHEYEPGFRIMYNWDIVGGAVSGLCEAYRAAVSAGSDGLHINLLLDSDYPDVTVRFSYPDRQLKLTVKRNLSALSVRIPDHCQALQVSPEHVNWSIQDDRLLFADVETGQSLTIDLLPEVFDRSYTFRNHQLKVRWEGERIIAMESAGKRLCFFPDICQVFSDYTQPI